MKHTYLLLFMLLSFAAQGQSAKDHYKKAEQLADNKEYKKALHELAQALEAEPDNTEYIKMQGGLLAMTEQYEEAYKAFSKVITLDRTDATAYLRRGLLFYITRDFETATKDYTLGLQYATEDSIKHALLINRSSSKVAVRDFAGAYDDLMIIYKSDSNNISMLNNLAMACDELGKDKETLKYLLRVVKLDPKISGTYVNLGFKYQKMGDYKTAETYFDKALELDPEEPLAYSNRAYNKYKMDDLKGAYKDIDKAIKIYPGNSYAYRTRALIDLKAGKKETACEDLQKALTQGFTEMYGDEVQKLQEENCKK